MTQPQRRARLAGLDARVLPGLARVLRGLGGLLGFVAGPNGPVGRRVAPLVRREPVVAVALLSVAVAAVLITLTGGDDQGAVRPAAVASIAPVSPLAHRLGPAPGVTVSSYLAAAAHRRSKLRSAAASQQLAALVDLTGYISPLAVDTLLAATPGVDVLRGFARVPPPADAKVHVLLTSADSNLATQLAAAQAAAQQVAAHFKHVVNSSLAHPTTRLQDEVDADAAQAADARVDAAGLGSDCGCVFALVVSGPVSQLEQLAQSPAVRVLDPAPLDASLDSLMVVPLEPQVTKTVPALDFAGD